jgi:hypothetical protein
MVYTIVQIWRIDWDWGDMAVWWIVAVVHIYCC